LTTFLKTTLSATSLAVLMLISSCATIVNLDNNKKWKMGIDVVLEDPAPITVSVNGTEAKHFRQYDGDSYHVEYVMPKKATYKLDVIITQNGVTKSGSYIGHKAEGLFWFEFLWVLLDHATGALRQYPAIIFEDMEAVSAVK
jgi:hypothetical protein